MLKNRKKADVSATQEKINRYFTRTVQHIHRVQNNMVLLVTKYSDKLGLDDEMKREAIHNVMVHDQSKFSEVQFIPYIELTEYYHQRKVLKNLDYKYPPGMEKKVDDAVLNHYHVENHHPERFKESCGKFTKLEAIETVCDLQAMAQEFNEGTCRKYFETVWKPKQSQHFYDDFNWEAVTHIMNLAIECFELEVQKR